MEEVAWENQQARLRGEDPPYRWGTPEPERPKRAKQALALLAGVVALVAWLTRCR